MMYTEDLQDHIKLAVNQNETHTIKEGKLHLSNGDKITVDCTITPRSVNKEDIEILIELNQADRHLRIMRDDQLIRQQQATRQVIRGLAHEIKNPLGGLRGAAQLLESELSTADLKEYTQIITKEADRLQNLVNRMLGPTHISHQEMINIHEVLEHVRHLTDAGLPEGINISVKYDPSIPDFMGNKDQLIQVMLNIMGNAVKALGTQGEIQIVTQVLRQFVINHTRYRLVLRADIIDNGPGIPEEISDKLFFPMVSGSAEGTGLGLSIAQTLVNQHNGIIECKSTVNETCFSILIPLEET